jgi:hypothetical protein
LRKGEFERIVGAAASSFSQMIEKGVIDVPTEYINYLLEGDEPNPEEISSELLQKRGNILLRDASNGTTIPVWVGGRVTLMMRAYERNVLCAIRGIIQNTKSEEE